MPTDAAVVAPYEPSLRADVRMPDGVGLATDVYLPRRGGKAPAVLIRTPYGRRGEIDAAPQIARLLNDCGIAVVAQDVRGKFDSGGEREPFVNELADGHATLDWLAAQPWSDGRAIPIGASYTGYAAWTAAASGHPALAGAVVRMTTCHVATEWLYRQGLFRLQMNGGWALFAWGGRELHPFDPDWSVRPLSSLPLDGADPRHLERWLRTPPGALWWVENGLSAAAPVSARVRVPVLHWGGWWDLLARGQIRDWDVVAGTGQRLVMGATDHDFHSFADVDSGAAARLPSRPPRTTLDAEFEGVIDFLLGRFRGDPPVEGVRWELTHAGWQESDGWPPDHRHTVRLYLADGPHATYGPEGGGLVHRPDSVPLTVGWTHDPADPVPSLETFVWGTLAHDYPDERDAQTRDDVLTFSGQPRAEPLDLAGPARVQLQVQAAAPRTQIAVTVSDVHPDGRALRILEGGCVVHDAESGQQVDVDLGPTGYRLRPGHRLRLAIAAGAHPRYLPPGGWSERPGPPCEHRLQLGRSSFLELSVLD